VVSIFLLKSHFTLPMPGKPAPVIVRFVHRDSIDPRSQATTLFKGAYTPENFEKYFLNHVTGVVLVTQKPKNHTVNRLLITIQKFLISRVDARPESGQESRLLISKRTLFAAGNRKRQRGAGQNVPLL
jgi:hypothetical protein